MKSTKPTSISESLQLFKETLAKRQKYVKSEHQAYGLELAKELDDWKHRALFIRLAKNTPRPILEKARYFVKDQLPRHIRSPYRLFMWKLKQINLEEKAKKE
ncbi:MAG TPA: hypothetical protein PK370_00540 [Candidatus Woesebacteria bacterium]|nr:hypothetical protein [Candidatus Woesebacteria bacterium]HPJ17163.1 hypothetical protein [Candidatus Woesebacteria bacterium]